MKTRHTRILSATIASAFLATTFALPAAEESQSHVTDEDLILANNPIIIKSRVRVNNEFSELGGGGYKDKLILGGLYSFGFDGQNKNFGAGFELPFLFNDPKDGGSDAGLGDFKLKVGQKLTDQPGGWRTGWFFETEFDTADNDVYAIANQRTQMAAGAGAAYPIFEKLVLSATMQYGWSLDDGVTTGEKNEWEGHLTASYKLMEYVSANLDYKGVLNTVGEDKYFNTLEPSISWTVGEKRNIGLVASWELPLDETNTNWTAKAGVIWFF